MIEITRQVSDITIGKLNAAKLLEELQTPLSKVKIVSLYNSNELKSYDPVIGEVIRIYVDVALDAAEIIAMDNLIAVHNPLDINLQIRQTYEAREKDGINYFNQIHDQTVLDVMRETITEAAAFVIELKLEDCFNKIKTGDWKTAKNRFELITNAEPPPNFDDYTQGVFNGITAYINDYITNNYE